jgi:hypothetical protein
MRNTKFSCLSKKQFGIAPGSKSNNRQPSGIISDNLKSLSAN